MSDHDSTINIILLSGLKKEWLITEGGLFYESQILLKKRVIFQNSTQPKTERYG